ncbi:MAG: hypothetical protein ACRDRL_11790, partial [Sciscionella sp.]
NDLRGGRPGKEEHWASLGGLSGRATSAQVESGAVLVALDNPYGIVTGPTTYVRRKLGPRETDISWIDGEKVVEVREPELAMPSEPGVVEAGPHFEDVTPKVVAAQVAVERRRLAYEVTRWLALGGVSVAIAWDDTGPRQVMTNQGLVGALSAQLATHLTGGLLVPCNECGRWAEPPHRPGERSWCKDCHDTKRPGAAAARDYRTRKRQRAADKGDSLVVRKTVRSRAHPADAAVRGCSPERATRL